MTALYILYTNVSAILKTEAYGIESGFNRDTYKHENIQLTVIL